MLNIWARYHISTLLNLAFGFLASVIHVVFVFAVASVIFAHLTEASWREAALDVLSYAFFASMSLVALSTLAFVKSCLTDWRYSRWDALANSPGR